MANIPFPLTGVNIDDMRFQTYELIRQVFEEKIGGADLGDVFSLPGDVLTLNLASPSGLTKAGNDLAVDPYSTGGMQINANGLSIKLVATGGLVTSASGLGILLDGASLSLSAAGLKVTSVPSNYTVVTHNTDTILTETDLCKIHVMDVSGGDRMFTLPDTTAAYVGYWVMLVRDGVANNLKVQTGGADVIWNSSPGGYIDVHDSLGVLDTHDFGSVYLIQVKNGQWTTPEFGIWTAY